jgi:hypothetical protein
MTNNTVKYNKTILFYKIYELAEMKGYEIRSRHQGLTANESFDKVITPFDFSEQNGGTYDSFR